MAIIRLGLGGGGMGMGMIPLGPLLEPFAFWGAFLTWEVVGA